MSDLWVVILSVKANVMKVLCSTVTTINFYCIDSNIQHTLLGTVAEALL